MNIWMAQWGGVEWKSYTEKFSNLPAIVIYGTSIWERRLLHLCQHQHVDVECFAVKNKKNSSDNIEGYPVREISELKAMGGDFSFIFLARRMVQSKNIDFLKGQGFGNVIPLDIQEFWLSDIEVRKNNPAGEKECPLCHNKLKLFLPEGAHMRFNAECPYCGSRERHRAYFLYWKRTHLFDGMKMRVLHFAPERAFNDLISGMEFIDYYPVDINPKLYRIREKVDITDIQYKDNMFDVIICNHVLEHIPDEKKALSELRRVLKKGGKAFLNVPIFKRYATTLEKAEYNTPELRLKYYGQDDHVRAYGLDYEERLIQAGFETKAILINKEFSREELERYGLENSECIYECGKV